MSKQDPGPGRQERARRTQWLRERGLTWEQIADVWESDYPDVSPRRAFRWAHDLSHQDVADRWNTLDLGEPTMTKSRIYEFEVWPHKGRRPSAQNIKMLARIYQTTGRRLLNDSEYLTYDKASRVAIDRIDYRHLDENSSQWNPASESTSLPLMFGTIQRSSASSQRERLTVETIESTLRRLYRLDDEFGGDDLCSMIFGYIHRAAVLFKAEHLSPAESARLHRALGGLTQIGGWLSIDANRDADAHRYLTTSLYTAYETDDLNLAGHVLGYMSLLALYRDRYREALSLGSTGASVAAASGTPKTRAILCMRVARAYARLGDAEPCKRQLDAAYTAFISSSSNGLEPQWTSYIDEIEICAQRGACFLDLGKNATTTREKHLFGVMAASALSEAIDGVINRAPERVRDLAHYKIRLAAAYALQDEPNQAISVAEDAYELSGRVSSTRISTRFAELVPLLRNYDIPEASELIEHIA